MSPKKQKHWTPSANDVERIHQDLTKLFESENDPISPPGIKDRGLLESACARPLTAIGDHEKYASLVLKLAALTQSLTKNHPFHNGNKRTALATLLTALHRNGLCLLSKVTDDDVFNFIVAVTADEYPSRSHGLKPDEVIKKIGWWIKNNTESSRRLIGTVKVQDFLDACRKAGMQCKSSNGSHIIVNPKEMAKGSRKSVKFSNSTRQLDGQTAAAFIRRLGLNAQNSGIDSNEFYDGAQLERQVIHRFIVALRRLAKT